MCTYTTQLCNAALVEYEDRLDNLIDQEVNCWFGEHYGADIDWPDDDDLEADVWAAEAQFVYKQYGWPVDGLYITTAEAEQLRQLWWRYKHPDGLPF